MSILLTTTIMRCYTSYDDGHPHLDLSNRPKKGQDNSYAPLCDIDHHHSAQLRQKGSRRRCVSSPQVQFYFFGMFCFSYCTNFFFAKLETLRGPNDGIKAQDDPTPNFATSTASTTTVVPNDDKRARDADAFQAHWYVFLVCYIFFLFFIASPNRIYVKTSRQQGSLGVSGRFRHLA